VERLTLILSPHLDDAVLSCPGYMQRRAPVVIATVFSASGDSLQALYRARRAEDRRAAGMLGASVAHLGFRDAPFRSPRYGSFCGIVFGQAREYRGTVLAVAAKIAALIEKLRPVQVLAPLAVGNHVDHRAVRDAALGTVDHRRLLFFEDRPYSLVRHQVRGVVSQPSGSLDAEYFEAAYVRSYLGRTRPATVRAKWSSVRPFPAKLQQAIQLRLKAAEVQAAVRAIQAYSTQVGHLFADQDELLGQYRSVPEILWRVTC
jgi:LmbE family N-acetylglucosaminyl deacetylase